MLLCLLTDLGCYPLLRSYSAVWHPFIHISTDKCRFFISCLLVHVLEGQNRMDEAHLLLLVLVFGEVTLRSQPISGPIKSHS